MDPMTRIGDGDNLSCRKDRLDDLHILAGDVIGIFPLDEQGRETGYPIAIAEFLGIEAIEDVGHGVVKCRKVQLPLKILLLGPSHILQEELPDAL